MATTDLGRFRSDASASRRERTASLASLTRGALTAVSSLRLTVVLFAISLGLVLAGTLAQRYYDIWRVVHDTFRPWWGWWELRWFVPGAFDWDPSLAIPMPGGKMLGAALGLNLLAAHAVRFRATARGKQLLGGVLMIALGGVITWAVIHSGLDDTVESELSPSFCNGLWHALRAGLGAGALVLCYRVALNFQRLRAGSQSWVAWLGVAAAALLMGVVLLLFVNPEARLNDSGLRILWQLLKATGASVVLWVGCRMVFAKRAGIVLLHGGIALMMFSELYTSQYAVEARVRFVEGQTVSYAEDIRDVELALVDKSDPEVDETVVVPGDLLDAAADSQEPLSHSLLPVDLRVRTYYPNARIRLRQPGEAFLSSEADDQSLTEQNPAGHGQLRIAEPLRTSTGVESEQPVDLPAAYVELLDKESSQSLGTYLLSPVMPLEETLQVDGRPLELAIRFRRIEKPYQLTLQDFTKEDYVGTNTPKNFESVVRLRDESQNVDREIRIWMNNPLRYRGDTLYQSSFDPNQPDYSELQVVTNTGWMIPYVACMIVATGMLAHFGSTIVRFVRRRAERAQRQPAADSTPSASDASGGLAIWKQWRRPEVFGPALITLLFALWVAGRAMPVRESATQMQIERFGRIPIAHGGRTQPLDSLARNTLRLISEKETFVDSRDERQPAVKWLLDTVTQADGWRDHRVFRIVNLEVLKALQLEPRKGYRYSFRELLNQREEYDQQLRAAVATAKDPQQELTLVQKKWLELDERVRRVLVLIDAFGSPDLAGTTQEEVQVKMRRLFQQIESLNQLGAARLVPPQFPDGSWSTTLEAEKNALFASFTKAPDRAPPDKGVELLRQTLLAYGAGDVQKFNSSAAEYRELIEERAEQEARYEEQLAREGKPGARKPSERLQLQRSDFEAYYNHFGPVVLCIALYVVAFVLAAAAWLGWFEGFNRAANWLLWFTFALHTLALVCRIYISGRPPVTNLYSSAVFIGWGAVLFALVMEAVYRLGLGNLLAAVVGFPTQLIAFYLSFDSSGDTLGVMQAVLDTNFWLGTHVVCISLGYTTTFLAGALGLIWILMDRLLGRLTPDQSDQLARMTYGAVCFSIFFSFVGTVLGGLWADDSWGRFWGWDPKENGALMIVIWNALVLHARWGKMVGPRGVAVLAVFGNIVTAWSWFGVNQLSIGLHSYGFTSGITTALIVFAISQLVMIALGMWPRGDAPTRPQAAST
jgi:ABC-type transport system involved in cytochrome c biogenesis permease subunit